MQQQDKKFSTARARKLLIIDPAVLDSDVLLKNRKPGYELIQLNANTAPIEQITQALTAKAPVGELVLVAHATPGQIHFSDDCVDTARLEQHRDMLQDWRNTLTNNAKLCIYACELAAGKTGQVFIEQLKTLTGADVAASSLPIGNTEAGLNWKLNHFTKFFEVVMPFNRQSVEAYRYALVPEIGIAGAGTIENDNLEFVVTLSATSLDEICITCQTLKDKGITPGSSDDFGEINDMRTIPAGMASETMSVFAKHDTFGLLTGKGRTSALVTLVERKTLYTVIMCLSGRHAVQLTQKVIETMEPLTARINTITIDNGSQYFEQA